MELSSSIYVSLLQAIYTLFAWTSYAAALQERRNMWTENCLYGLKFHGTENPDFFVFPFLCYSQIWISPWLCWLLPPAAWERKVIKKNLSSLWMTKWMFWCLKCRVFSCTEGVMIFCLQRPLLQAIWVRMEKPVTTRWTPAWMQVSHLWAFHLVAVSQRKLNVQVFSQCHKKKKPGLEWGYLIYVQIIHVLCSGKSY